MGWGWGRKTKSSKVEPLGSDLGALVGWWSQQLTARALSCGRGLWAEIGKAEGAEAERASPPKVSTQLAFIVRSLGLSFSI